jgi:hypothetical protein
LECDGRVGVTNFASSSEASHRGYAAATRPPRVSAWIRYSERTVRIGSYSSTSIGGRIRGKGNSSGSDQ